MNLNGPERKINTFLISALFIISIVIFSGCQKNLSVPSSAIYSLNLEEVREALSESEFDFQKNGPALFLQRWQSSCRLPILEYFLQAGTDPSGIDWKGNSLLMYACSDDLRYSSDGNDVFNLLLEYGADIYYTNPFGETALDFAVAAGDFEKVSLLLKKGVMPTAQTLEASIPDDDDVMEYERYKISKLILEELRKNEIEYEIDLPLEIALLGNSEGLLEYLRMNPNWTPSQYVLVAAAAYCSVDLFKELVLVAGLPEAVRPNEKGWDISMDSTINQVSALNIASSYGNTAICQYITHYYSDNLIYNDILTALIVALNEDQIETANYLFQNYPDLKFDEDDLESLFTTLSQEGAIQGIDWLLDVYNYVPSEYNYSLALYYAALFGQQDVIEYFFMKGVDLNVCYKESTLTAINAAARQGNLALVQWLTEHGAKNDGLCPALRSAAVGNHLEVVKYLHENQGADINGVMLFADGSGDTALQSAIDYGYFELVKYLVENGADTEHAAILFSTNGDAAGVRSYKSALEYAQRYGNNRITKFLQKYA